MDARITAYAQRLMRVGGLDWQRHRAAATELDRPQRGAEVHFALAESPAQRSLSSTRFPNTLYGATYMVLAPEHLVDEIVTEDQCPVRAYRERTARKSDERASEQDKLAWTGAYQSVNGQRIPGLDR